MKHQATTWDGPLTLASNCLVGVSFRERAAAAATAGFDAIGLSIAEYDRARGEGLVDSDIRSILADHGLALSEMEALVGFAARDQAWSSDALPHPTSEAEVERMLGVAELLGATRLQVLGTFGAERLEQDAVDAFGALCDRAADRGVALAIEFVPGTNIPDVAVATAVAQQAGRPNGGICVDSWHFFRGNPNFQALEALEPELVTVLQFNDGALVPVESDYLAETRNHRLLPGQGEFDLIRFMHALNAPGVPISAEVLSADLRQLPASAAVERIFSAAGDVLARAGSASVTPTRIDDR